MAKESTVKEVPRISIEDADGEGKIAASTAQREIR